MRTCQAAVIRIDFPNSCGAPPLAGREPCGTRPGAGHNGGTLAQTHAAVGVAHEPAFHYEEIIMTKTEAIRRVNEALGSAMLNERNTYWSSSAPHAGDEGWWLNLPLSQFRKEIHILLNHEKAKTFRHLTIKPSEILSPAMKFRCKDQMADVFISSANPKKLVDVLAGGTKHNFGKHVMAEYAF